MNVRDGNGKHLRIALFDSGVGGLSVLRQMAGRAEASTRFVYLADTARCPYGNRSFSEIAGFADEISRWLADLGVDRIVMACNTSAAVAANELRKSLDIPVHDIITPAAFYCAENHKRVAVLATATTCKSGAFSRTIKSFNDAVIVNEIPCPDLVPLVESGVLSGDVVESTIAPYVKKVVELRATALVLGCTHFPFLQDAFRKLLPPQIELVDPADHLSLNVLGQTRSRDVVPSHIARHVFFTTGDPLVFASRAETCLGLPSGILASSVVGIRVEDLVSKASPEPQPGAATQDLSLPSETAIPGVVQPVNIPTVQGL